MYDHVVWCGVSFYYRHHPLLHLAFQNLLELLSSEGIEERVKDGGSVGHHKEAKAEANC